MLTPFFPLWRSQLAAWGPRLAEHLAVLRVATLAQLEERFADCLPELLFAKADKALNSRDRIYTPWRTFWCFLCQCLNPHTSCREAVRQVQALYTSELPLFHQLMQHLSRGDIVLGDRGFGNYVIVCLLQSLGIDFLGRSARKVDARRRLQVTLVTTLLDAALYPAEQILRAYLRRWRLEMCLDDLKTTLGMEMLRCQSPAMVQKEALLYRIAHNLIRIVMAQAALAHEVPIERLSFKGSLDALRQFNHAMCQARSKRKRRQLWEELLRSLAADQVPERPDRREPRAIKRKKNQYPRLNAPRRKFRDHPKRHARRTKSRLRKIMLK